MSFAQPFKDYQILARVGAGAMGTVFKARHKKLDRIVALKVLRPSLARDERYVDRLRREARIVASLSHPNIVTGYDIGEEGGYHFFVMEFIEGQSLRGLLAEWGVFPEAQVLKAAMQATRALDHAFQRGIIHRDIKPGNILIDEQGNLKLTDMGLAKGPTDMTLTRDGATVGTPQYISPEQARNPQDVDVRSDLYSLGATLYHMATGQPPFRGDTMAEIITKVLHEHAEAAHEVNPAISEGLSLVIRKLLAKDLALRYQTPAELLLDLERVQRAERPDVDRSRLDAAERGGAPNYLRRSLWAVAGALVIAGAVWFGSSLRSEGPTVERPEEFLDRLDRELAGLAQAPARYYQRLQQAAANPPAGTFQPLQARMDQFVKGVQLEFDAAMQELRPSDWPEVRSWLEDPGRWPSAEDFEREKVTPKLERATGFAADQLPARVRTRELDQLRDVVRGFVRMRDDALVVAVGNHAAGAMAARTDELLDAGDFRAAEQLWNSGLPQFCDGQERPRLDRLGAATLQQVQQKWEQARQRARQDIDRREASLKAALERQAKATLLELRQRNAAADADVEMLQAALAQQYEALRRAYPSSQQFHVQVGSWTEIDEAFAALRLQLQLRADTEAGWRVNTRTELAWRTLVNGDLGDAAAVLSFQAGNAVLDAKVQRHRDAITAADRVAAAVLRALPTSPRRFLAVARSEQLQTVELTVDLDGGQPVLRIPAEGRRAAFTEFTFGSLLKQAQAAVPDLFAAMPPDQVERGRLVLVMASEDLAGIGPRLQQPGDDFLIDSVWPLIERVRKGQGAVAAVAADGLRVVQDKLAAAQTTGQVEPLAAALDAFQQRFAVAALDDGTRLEMQRARSWLATERARRQRELDLRQAAPGESEVQVGTVGAGFRATVRLLAPGLRQLASPGFAVVDDALVFESGRGQEVGALHLRSGLPTAATEIVCRLELAIPVENHADRTWLIGCQGCTALVTVTADDSVYAAWLEGSDASKDEVLRKALRQALSHALQPGPRVAATPGAWHRWTLSITAAPRDDHAELRLSFERETLCTAQRKIDPQRAVDLVLRPAPGIGVRRVEFSALLPE